jgi:long-chain acyl-CoA synthetase
MRTDVSWWRPIWDAIPAPRFAAAQGAPAAEAPVAPPVAPATSGAQVAEREAFIQRQLPVLPPATEANVVAMFRERCARFGDAPHWRVRSPDGAWKSMTWSASQAVVNELIAGLSALGVRPGTKVGILSETRWEWLAADWAVLGLGAVSVPLYASHTADTITFMLNDSQVEYVFVENAEQYVKIARVRAAVPSLKALIMLEEVEAAEEGERGGLRVISFAALRRLSGKTPEQAEALARDFAAEIQPEQVASIIYTSGTTNRPKGVIHTHASFMGQVRSTGAALTTFVPGTTHLLWLPLAHVLGREEHLIGVDRGGITYIAGSTATLARDIRETHPNIIVGVPRIYEKAYATIEARAMSGGAAQKRIFNWARAVGASVVERRQRGEPLSRWLRLQYALADRLVFGKVREALGGALDFSITGGAPIGLDILRFFHGAGVLILEGWGLTETMGAVTVNLVNNYRLGTVGPPTMDHEIRIAPDGEVLLRGPCVFSGYLNLPEENAAALDSEGWLHTGDLGRLDADGFLRISGRKKELIVLANGKKIVPDPVETLLKGIPGVAHAAVYGDRKPYLVALLTLDPEAVMAWARLQGLTAMNAEEVAATPRFAQHLADGVARVNSQLARFETVKRYTVAPGDFTIENGLLTPTLKIKRVPLYARFHDLIEGLYVEA